MTEIVTLGVKEDVQALVPPLIHSAGLKAGLSMRWV